MSESTGAQPDEPASILRPYFLTRGRARSEHLDLPLETQVTIADAARHRSNDLRFEHQRIVAMASEPLSLAEIASRLEIPLGVARVLVADLVVDGILETHGAVGADDAALVRRLMDGIRAL